MGEMFCISIFVFIHQKKNIHMNFSKDFYCIGAFAAELALQ